MILIWIKIWLPDTSIDFLGLNQLFYQIKKEVKGYLKNLFPEWKEQDLDPVLEILSSWKQGVTIILVQELTKIKLKDGILSNHLIQNIVLAPPTLAVEVALRNL